MRPEHAVLARSRRPGGQELEGTRITASIVAPLNSLTLPAIAWTVFDRRGLITLVTVRSPGGPWFASRLTVDRRRLLPTHRL